MRIPVVDFETEGIRPVPYVPKPLGFSEWVPGKRAKYWAFGHDSGNNCTEKQAKRRYRELCRSGPVMFFNAPFDIRVGEKWGVPKPSTYHDVSVMANLHKPFAPSFKLKDLCAQELDRPPEAQDALREWCKEHLPKEFTRKKNSHMEHLRKVPGDIVGRYANQDVRDTRDLGAKVDYVVTDSRMGIAYDREIRLQEVAEGMQQTGMLIDGKRLKADAERWEREVERMDQWMCKQMRIPHDPDVIQSTAKLANAMYDAGIFDGAVKTPTGKMSTRKDVLEAGITVPAFYKVLMTRRRWQYSLSTFARPWIAQWEEHGRVFTEWRTLKGEWGNGAGGAITGRISSSPNFQNITKRMLKVLATKTLGLGPPPMLRDYVVPGRGHRIIRRDFSQQEFRLLAHYEDGALMDAYNENPDLDVHVLVSEMIRRIAKLRLSRDDVKTVGFAILYGRGARALAAQLNTTPERARKLIDAYYVALPGIRAVQNELRELASKDEPYHTWGGRRYYCEPPSVVTLRNDEWGEWQERRSWEYKMINYCVQGSAADVTKEAMLRYYEVMYEDAELFAQVHDELLVRTPTKIWRGEMKKLREAMASIELDVPMTSEGKVTSKSWARMEDTA